MPLPCLASLDYLLPSCPPSPHHPTSSLGHQLSSLVHPLQASSPPPNQGHQAEFAHPPFIAIAIAIVVVCKRPLLLLASLYDLSLQLHHHQLSSRNPAGLETGSNLAPRRLLLRAFSLSHPLPPHLPLSPPAPPHSSPSPASTPPPPPPWLAPLGKHTTGCFWSHPQIHLAIHPSIYPSLSPYPPHPHCWSINVHNTSLHHLGQSRHP